MKLRDYLILCAVLASFWTLFPTSAWAQSTTVAIRGVTIVDVTNGTLQPGQTVLVEGNRIGTAGNSSEVDVPPDATVVAGEGAYLVPGLWDTHVHSVWAPGADAGIGSLPGEDWQFPLFLAHGITGVRNMNDATADVTLGLTNEVKRRVAEGDLPGPRVLANGPSIDGDPPLPTNPVVVRTAAEARAVVDSLADAGADFIKVYENLSREAYFAIMDRARRRGLPVDGHVPFRVTAEEVAEAGQRTVEHPEALAAGCSTEAEAAREEFASALVDYESLPDDEKFLVQFRYYGALYDAWDPAACTATFEALRRNGVAVAADFAYHRVVNLDQVLSDTASMRFVPRAVRRAWENELDSETGRMFQSILRPMLPVQEEQVRRFHEAGGTLLAATDVGAPPAVPGVSLHDNLELLVEAGITPLEALQTATLNPARALDLGESLGTIETGKLADLVLLEANPLEDIRNTRRIRAVIADGRLYRRADLDRLLAEVEASVQ